MRTTSDAKPDGPAAPEWNQGSRQKLRDFTRSHFEPLYGYELSDVDVDEIIESLAAYRSILREIKSGLEAPKSPSVNPAALPKSGQVRPSESPIGLPQIGQLR